ncbi:hypothetical protein F0U62_02325 [Cystobacter fuscus]|uniref:hypothetical protein n=1 Tax=Cystobacter fuscus TaxID=43 RepID=UPI002B2E053A|nr:hypothetical protein F0U62_02325 [Cystobacter fuscus]
MNVVSSISGVALAMALSAAPAYASTPIACGTRVDSFLNASRSDGKRVLGIGSAVTARGALGFTHFAMAQGYQIETTPLHTPAAPQSATFALGYNATSDVFTGDFTEVFTDRGNGDEDRTSLWVARGGSFWLRSVTWNGSWLQLQNVACYAGPQNQLVVTGSIDNPGFGSDHWSFVLMRNAL